MSLKTLREKWYAVLKDHGFEDIENQKDQLKDPCHTRAKDHLYHSENYREAKRRYFEIAEEFLNIYRFENRMDEFVWEKHVEGFSIRKTIRELPLVKIAGYHPLSHDAIWKRLKRLKKAMWLRFRE